MKKYLAYFVIGLVFGIVLIKSEVASWFRIYEMFQFRSFHMYGVIGTAVCFGIIVTQIAKRQKTFKGDVIEIPNKRKGYKNYLLGGIIFGLGWALGGACPGPMYALLGSGFSGVLVLFLGAYLGTLVYGVFKNKLPH